MHIRKVVKIAILLAFFLVGCTTTSQNPFSAKPVVQFDQAGFFVLYLDVSKAYVLGRYQIAQACAAKALTPETCAQLADVDAKIQRIAEEINTSIQNPAYPLDLQKIQQFAELVLGVLVKVGVKGVSGGLIP